MDRSSLPVETALLSGPGIAAVSGGPDSVALALALHDANIPFTLAHVNHQLRGMASDADEQFVIDLARQLGRDVRTTRIDLSTLPGNLEANARRARYDWLTALAREQKVFWIATGHTANDQAETVLHRILRGTGLQGLRGIALQREMNGIRIVRPMLSVSRSTVLEYLARRGQVFRQDATNEDTRFTRNRIRHQLMPVLESFQPEIVHMLGRLAEQAAEQFQQEKFWIDEKLLVVEMPRAGAAVVLDTSRMIELPDAMIRGIMRAIWQRENWPMAGMTYEHWRRLTELVRVDSTAADMPGGIHVRRKRTVLTLTPAARLA